MGERQGAWATANGDSKGNKSDGEAGGPVCWVVKEGWRARVGVELVRYTA